MNDVPATHAPVLDPITVEVIGAALSSIVEETGEALIRASYSTNIKERRDCSTALFDTDGNTLCQAEHIPIHLGSFIGQLLLWGFTFAIFYHLANGIRHLLWDFGWGFELGQLRLSGIAMLVFAVGATLITLIAGYALAGGQ